MITGLLDHLWQSTLFAGGAGLLTLVLLRNPAWLRYRLWFAASLKFLVPFAALSALGERLSQAYPASVPRLVLAIQPTAEKLSAPARSLAVEQQAGFNLVPVLAALWFAGFVAILGLRLLRWCRLHAVMGEARDLDLHAPVHVKISGSLLEPGLVGILRPVVLLPEGLMPRLSMAERDAILAHEFSHLRRGDNVTAALHMLVEALFWFYPPVWLIGARLIAERERACDERVLAEGHDAEVYARGILKVCRFCVQSPLACVPGASGADLGRRVRQIMSNDSVLDIGGAQKMLLAGALAVALGLPVAGGFTPPLIAAVQLRVAASQVAAGIAAVSSEAMPIAAAPVAAPKIRRLHKWKIAPAAQQKQISPQPLAEAPPLPDAPPASDSAATVAQLPAAAPVAAAQAATSQEKAQATAVQQVLVALYPQGNGDPDGLTCRSPETLPGSRLPGPRVCQTNRLWASLRARHEDITPDGQGIIMPNGSEMHAGFGILHCSAERVTSSGPAVFNTAFGAPATVCF